MYLLSIYLSPSPLPPLSLPSSSPLPPLFLPSLSSLPPLPLPPLPLPLPPVDRGIYIKSVNPGGPAWLSGCVQVKDRIVGVDGIDLRSLANMDAAGHLRNSGRVVRLVLRRHAPSGSFRVTTLRGPGEVPLVAEGNTTPHKYNKTGQVEGQREWVEPDGGVANDSPLSDDDLIMQRWRERIPFDRTIRVCTCIRY